jgi:5-deoxy-D-glucuronate isomerase
VVKSGRKLIQDEFTQLKVSRQRKWQLRRRAEGRCGVCAAPALGKFCDMHAVKEAIRQLERRGATAITRRGKWLVMAGERGAQ